MTKLNKFEAALRAKFKTPQDALRCLGLDESLLNGENNDKRSKSMARRIARDQESMTVDDLVTAIEALSEEERLELMNLLQGSGEDARGGGRDRRRARDAEWNMEGRPKVGPNEEQGGLERDRDAQDRRRRVGMDSAQVADFARRFPDAARIKIV
jgi:hypothetical protein